MSCRINWGRQSRYRSFPHPSRGAGAALFEQVRQIASVIILAETVRLREQLVAVDIAHIVGDLLDAGDLEPLAHFDRADIFAGAQQILMRAGVEPGIAAAELFDLQCAAPEIDIVEICDFKLAPRRRLQPARDVDDLVVVEIKAGDGPMRARPRRLLLDRDGLPGRVEFDDAIGRGITDLIGEDGCAQARARRVLQQPREATAIKDVVAEDERRRAFADEVAADQESLRQAAGFGLLGIAERDAPSAAVAEQALEAPPLQGWRDDEDVADPRWHWRRPRGVNH